MWSELKDAVEDLGDTVHRVVYLHGPTEWDVELLPSDSCPSAHRVAVQNDVHVVEAAAALVLRPFSPQSPSPTFIVALCAAGFGVATHDVSDQADLDKLAGRCARVHMTSSSARYESLNAFLSDHAPWCSLEAQLEQALASRT
uniref:Uncharacterized protein n=1 Tax=Neobodo designis TaxID=312471 RepID=A0A7S1PKK5_NEODS